MENPEYLFYIVFGLIYILTRGIRKRKKNVPPPKSGHKPVDQGNGHPAEKPQLSFEELLKELTGRTTKTQPEPVKEADLEPEPEPEPELKPKPKPKPVPEPEYKTKSLVSETKPLPSFDDEKIRKIYERPTTDKKRKTVSEIAAEQKETNSFRFKAFELKEFDNKFAAELKKMLQNPEDAKKAIVLAEIINRKY